VNIEYLRTWNEMIVAHLKVLILPFIWRNWKTKGCVVAQPDLNCVPYKHKLYSIATIWTYLVLLLEKLTLSYSNIVFPCIHSLLPSTVLAMYS
jgi:hypothetical protein